MFFFCPFSFTILLKINSMRILYSFFIFVLFANVLSAQKKMDHTTFDQWNRISEKSISNNGDWVAYVIKPGKGDPTLNLYNTRDTQTYTFDRADGAKIDFNSGFVCFKIHPPIDTIEMLKRKKTKGKDMPGDTIGIFNFKTRELERISDVQSFKMAEKAGDYLVLKMKEKKDDEKPEIKSTEIKTTTEEEIVVEKVKQDSTKVKKRKEGGDKGTVLRVINMLENKSQEFQYITDFQLAESSSNILFHSSGTDTLEHDQLLFLDVMKQEVTTISNLKGKYLNLAISEDGQQTAYMINADTTNAEIEPYDLYHWSLGNNEAHLVAKSEPKFVEEGWIMSKHNKPIFSKDGSKMIFGVSPKPLIQDSLILDDEIVNVEVWSHTDQVLYTMQEVRQEREKKRSYDCVYNLKNKTIIQLENFDLMNVNFDDDLEHEWIIGVQDNHYQKSISWEGHDYNDVYRVNTNTGEKEMILEKLYGNVSLSPFGKYGLWYSQPDSVWNSINIRNKKVERITDAQVVKCYDELNDRPMDAWSYGTATWVGEDEGIIVYDRYDLWKLDPSGKNKPVKLTNGRKDKIEYRYINLNKELKSIPNDTTILLSVGDKKDKSSGVAFLDLQSNKLTVIEKDDYSYSRRILKAKNSKDIVYTKENFDVFPDLIHSQVDNFKNGIKFSSANPQQKDYDWGSISLMKWEGVDGQEMEGLLVLPDNFDKNKKYPLIVNFYERSSDGLHRHRAPYPHRSTINYSYYANKGYIIFNPDIHYRIGEPGESCYDAVVSGVKALVEKGFIDESRMGVQGHSWGGYQIAHLLTRTNMFKCAESGAPVVNMISAYGGIRWGSGMSRMFQYEHTQSRLGATLWEDPQVYIDNSPIFNVDKIKTPVLILHNDKDGAVPWYQGIEFFMAMRRLNKKAWMLNYNDEPHWPVKRQNRIDFNRRMEQFFDHYLMNKPMPEWMEKGVPALEKGINKGY